MSTYENIRYDYALPSGSGGALVPIKTLTASSSSTLSFVHGSSDVVLDSTYRTYLFKFITIHPATDNAYFQVNFNDGSSDLSKTSSTFREYHTEAGSSPLLDYLDGLDLSNSTSEQTLLENQGNGNDECISGYLYLFSPSSTTYVKHYIGRAAGYQSGNAANGQYTGGYVNSTSAVTTVTFQFNSGNIDAGTIKLYGIA
jgi:hypothetical protein